MDYNLEEAKFKEDNSVDITVTYPYSDEYDYHSIIEVIDLDVECEEDLRNGNGFIVSAPMNTNKKNVKAKDGIYSSKFGQKLGDANPNADRYSCECGFLKSRINNNIKCPVLTLKTFTGFGQLLGDFLSSLGLSIN